MSTFARFAFVATLCVSTLIAQSTADRPIRFMPSRSTVSQTELIAGIHGYPDRIIAALCRLADSSDVLRRVATAIGDEKDIDPRALGLPSDATQAVADLLEAPDAVVIAAAHAAELRELADLARVAPEAFAARIEQVRSAYASARGASARAWQYLMESDPVALGEYREALTNFCESQRRENAAFACAVVADRQYYYACPPIDAFRAFLEDNRQYASLRRAVDRWAAAHGEIDIRAELDDARDRTAPAAGAPMVIDLPADRRAAMWRAADPGVSEWLVPVIMQPADDQPSAARIAWASAEHARQWSGRAGRTAPPRSIAAAHDSPQVVYLDRDDAPAVTYDNDANVWDQLDAAVARDAARYRVDDIPAAGWYEPGVFNPYGYYPYSSYGSYIGPYGAVAPWSRTYVSWLDYQRAYGYGTYYPRYCDDRNGATAFLGSPGARVGIRIPAAGNRDWRDDCGPSSGVGVDRHYRSAQVQVRRPDRDSSSDRPSRPIEIRRSSPNDNRNSINGSRSAGRNISDFFPRTSRQAVPAGGRSNEPRHTIAPSRADLPKLQRFIDNRRAASPSVRQNSAGTQPPRRSTPPPPRTTNTGRTRKN